MSSARISGIAIALLASVAVGCAGPVAQITSTTEAARHDDVQRGYDLGYDRGKSAGERGQNPDSTMPGKHDAETAAAFKRGYEDGYAGRENRHGPVESRTWMRNDEALPADMN